MDQGCAYAKGQNIADLEHPGDQPARQASAGRLKHGGAHGTATVNALTRQICGLRLLNGGVDLSRQWLGEGHV